MMLGPLVCNDKRLWYTSTGERMENEVVAALTPVVQKWVASGCSISDLQLIISSAVNNMLLAEEICKNL